VILFGLWTVDAVDVGATPEIKNRWLSVYPYACNFLKTAAEDCNLCHKLAPPEKRAYQLKHNNSYGVSLAQNNNDIEAVESLDSDGDSQSNLDEIENCTLPGDPTSTVDIGVRHWGHLKNRYK
jgi:hypothetical protein